jgi:hypothetical protein
LLWALLAGAVLVALEGLFVAAVSPHDSVQAANRSVGRRYRGIGVNPNTVAMLFAVGVPLAAALWLDARNRTKRLLAAGACLLAGSIVAAGSRGAAAAAVMDLLVLAVAHGLGPSHAPSQERFGRLMWRSDPDPGCPAPLSAAETRERTLVETPGTRQRCQYILRWREDRSGGSELAQRLRSSGRLRLARAVRQGVTSGARPRPGDRGGGLGGHRVRKRGPELIHRPLPAARDRGPRALLALLAAWSQPRCARRIAAVVCRLRPGSFSPSSVVRLRRRNVATLGIWMCAFLPAGRE